MVAPDFRKGAFALSWMDFAAPIGLGGIWLADFLSQLEKRPLLPLEIRTWRRLWNMAENKHDPDEPRNPHVRHEQGDVNAWAVGKFGIGLALIVRGLSWRCCWGCFNISQSAKRSAAARRRPWANAGRSCRLSRGCRRRRSRT